MDQNVGVVAGRIHVLSKAVQNKIAAGEVVERPASVIKELVENALDAGADQVHVDLEGGGRELIRVADNGCGMHESDLTLAMERHATSKIEDAEDIFAVRTLGFRGEALPSIASVSRLTLVSCPGGSDAGHRLKVEGGACSRTEPCACRAGTSVEVRDLFYNTPVRLKFLKRAAAETTAANEALMRIALGHPQVSFTLTNNGKRTFAVPAQGDAAERIAALFGPAVGGQLLAVKRETEGLTVSGFVARPPESRPNSKYVYTFLNGRWIQHAGLRRVVRDAFEGQLPARRYPVAFLYLRVDPSRVDVNVHPTKEEVRFEDERRVTGSVRRAVDAALQAERGSQEVDAAGTGLRCEVPGASGAQPLSGGSRGAAAVGGGTDQTSGVAEAAGAYVAGASAQHAAYVRERVPSRASAPDAPAQLSDPAPAQSRLALKGLRGHTVVGQVGRRYLIVECEEGVKLVDQHALHERWNYEKLQDRERPILSQKLLAPVVIELSPADGVRFAEALPVLREAGFEVEAVGERSLSVHAVPEILPTAKAEQVIRDVFVDLESGRRGMRSIRQHVLASLACRSAVLAGQQLAPAEVTALMDRFAESRQPLTCPHGRPTTLTLTWAELERRFGRH